MHATVHLFTYFSSHYAQFVSAKCVSEYDSVCVYVCVCCFSNSTPLPTALRCRCSQYLRARYFTTNRIKFFSCNCSALAARPSAIPFPFCCICVCVYACDRVRMHVCIIMRLSPLSLTLSRSLALSVSLVECHLLLIAVIIQVSKLVILWAFEKFACNLFKNNCNNYSGSNNLKMNKNQKQTMDSRDVNIRDTPLIKYENNLQY